MIVSSEYVLTVESPPQLPPREPIAGSRPSIHGIQRVPGGQPASRALFLKLF